MANSHLNFFLMLYKPFIKQVFVLKSQLIICLFIIWMHLMYVNLSSCLINGL